MSAFNYEFVGGDGKVYGPFTAAVAFDHVPSLAGVRAALPPYMVPSLVVGVESWPRSSSGKVDRRRLPAPDAAAIDTAATAPEPL